MLKKTITFIDENGVKAEDTFYFNLTKAEVLELNLIDDLRAVGQSKDARRIITTFKRIVRHAVGSKIGSRFVKNEEYADVFMASDAYSELFIDILSGDDSTAKMTAFTKGILPEELSIEQDPLPEVNSKTK